MKLSFQFGLAASLETFQSWSCIPLCWVELWSYHVKCNWYFFCTTMEYTSTSAFSVGLQKKPMICKVLSVCIWILFFNKEHIFQKQQMLWIWNKSWKCWKYWTNGTAFVECDSSYHFRSMISHCPEKWILGVLCAVLVATLYEGCGGLGKGAWDVYLNVT